MEEKKDYTEYAIEFCRAKRHMHDPKNEKEDVARGKGGILSVLDFHSEPITPGDLAATLKVGSSRIANALKDLEEDGLVKRENDPNDKRKTLVILTDKGKEKCDSLRKQFEGAIYSFVSEIGEEEFYHYLSLEKKFHECMERYRKEHEIND